MGEIQNQSFQLSFNASLKVDFQGSRVTSDGGLILVRELDERLGFGELIEQPAAAGPTRAVGKIRSFPSPIPQSGIEHHAGELFPQVGFIVTNLTLPSPAVVRSYNKRGTAEQWIKEGKQAVKMTRLSCHRFRSNEVRLWLSVIAYNLGNPARRDDGWCCRGGSTVGR